jgi:hypothetical protein
MILSQLIKTRKETEWRYEDIHVSLTTENTEFLPHREGFGPFGTINGIQLSQYAYRQLLKILDIKNDFLARLTPDTASKVLSETLGQIEKKDFKLRTLDGIIRGIVSPTYKIRNHSEILEEMAKHTGEEADVHVLQNHGFMAVRYHEKLELASGFCIGNGELGESSTWIAPFIYRKVCENGMIVASREVVFRKVHRGNSEYSLEDGFRQAVSMAGQSLSLFRMAKKASIENPELEIEQMLRKLQLPKNLTAPIFAAYNVEPESNGFGIINAFTRSAQNFPAEKRVQIERAASRLLLNVYN